MKDDTVSRAAVMQSLTREYNRRRTGDGLKLAWIEKAVNEVPAVQPEVIRCKDCKHWRDSDGVYRRGVNAESKCPLNTQEVYAGTFYCGYAERRTDEK